MSASSPLPVMHISRSRWYFSFNWVTETKNTFKAASLVCWFHLSILMRVWSWLPAALEGLTPSNRFLWAGRGRFPGLEPGKLCKYLKKKKKRSSVQHQSPFLSNSPGSSLASAHAFNDTLYQVLSKAQVRQNMQLEEKLIPMEKKSWCIKDECVHVTAGMDTLITYARNLVFLLQCQTESFSLEAEAQSFSNTTFN